MEKSTTEIYIKSIKDALDRITPILLGKNRHSCTDIIMATLTEIAYENYDLHVFAEPNSYEDTTNEYLFDIIWYKPETESIFFVKKVHLIGECELDARDNEVLYDFYKLLIGRASLKLMIFVSHNVKAMQEKMENIIKSSEITHAGDYFLLAGWSDTEESFEYYEIIK